MAERTANRLSIFAQWFGVLATAWVLLDSLLTYFLKHWVGFLPPVNALLIVILAVILLTWGVRVILPPAHITVLLIVAAFGMIGAKVFYGDLEMNQLGAIALSLSAFFVAFFAFRWSDSAELFRNVFLTVAFTYVAVCVIALLKVSPSLFPVINAVWSDKGVLELRPEVTTDQNFQIYYLLPLALLITLPFKPVRSTLVLLGIIGALFVLAKLQTRSGVLVFGATVAMALAAPFWTSSLGRRKVFLLPLILLAAAAINYNVILHAGTLLIDRFHDSDNTAYSRWIAFMFTVRHIADPAWWLPRGTTEFVNLYGYVPHSNITAMYVEGGLLGLVMWVVVFVVPLVALARLFLQRKLDDLATLVLLGGVASMVIQLSLNVPFFKQPWLWAGAVVGTLTRVRADLVSPGKEEVTQPIGVAKKSKMLVRYAKMEKTL